MYSIYFNDGEDGTPLSNVRHICSPKTTEYTVVGLTKARAVYQFQIQAHGSCPGAGNTPPVCPDDAACTGGSVLCPATNYCTLPSPMGHISRFYTAARPEPISNLQIQSGSYTKTSVIARWSITESAGDKIPITGFKMYRDDGQGGDYIHVDSLPTSSHLSSAPSVSSTELGNQYEFANLVTGREYHFYLDVCNGVGCTSSNVLGPVMIASVPGKPPPPTLRSSAASPTPFLELNLFSPSDNGGSPITGLQIHKDDGLNGLLSPWMTVDQSTDYKMDTSVVAGRTYRYKVVAINAVGESVPSVVASFLVAGKPAQPNAPGLVSQTRDTIHVGWTAPANNGGSDVTSFTLYRNDGIGGPVVPVFKGARL